MLISLVLAAFVSAAQASPVQDACSLLTPGDIAAVLGEPMHAGAPATQLAGGVLMSQCVFGTSSTRPVSIAVAGTAGRGTAVSPKEYWARQFHRTGRGARDDREREGETTPRPVPGIGDEAYWAGNRIAAALYVLRGDVFIRVSVGGIRDEQERIDKSKALARAALRRLRGQM